MTPELTDLVGQVINEGDYVAYATRVASEQYMHVMRVDKITYDLDDYDRERWTLRGEVVVSTLNWADELPRKTKISVRHNGWLKVPAEAMA